MIRWAALTGVLAVAGGLWLRHRYLVVLVDGQSMLPTYVHGDRLLIRRSGTRTPRTGSVVVFARPRRGPDGTVRWGDDWMVKRVAAVPGDPVPASCRQAAPEEHLVPPGRLAVLGDNPGASSDSRIFGLVPRERLLGVVSRRIGGAPDGGGAAARESPR